MYQVIPKSPLVPAVWTVIYDHPSRHAVPKTSDAYRDSRDNAQTATAAGTAAGRCRLKPRLAVEFRL